MELLIESLDGNHDGFFSSSEFKNWLFPAIRMREMSAATAYLQGVIRGNFNGDVRAFYDEFKR